ncbi:two-component system, OmpR family, response regulator [Modicisalibacter ilicicola DSM 19980]|uniref:Two-component system, OmpR family, response regulator n=1 Tax=Modicisalibacter ilicicola DSM 19980 TaxID=1121942 RepID=A0A1M5B793_9GAMM|nr:two-component system, OmpR family, response regulator [Halomonas ilicicola DSM 19980]
MRILLVEDDPVLGDGLCEGLRLDGHTVEWLTDGREAEHALDADAFDVVVLDLALPGSSGLSVLSRWRAAHYPGPVLILTAYGATQDCIAGLDLGADDYMVKPVDLGELEARLRALVRRANRHTDDYLRHGPVCMSRADKRVWVDQRPVDLSAHEFVALEALLERPGRLVSREQLETRLYGWGDGPESNSLQVLIHKLRHHIGARHIETVRGLGYRLAT